MMLYCSCTFLPVAFVSKSNMSPVGILRSGCIIYPEYKLDIFWNLFCIALIFICIYFTLSSHTIDGQVRHLLRNHGSIGYDELQCEILSISCVSGYDRVLYEAGYGVIWYEISLSPCAAAHDRVLLRIGMPSFIEAGYNRDPLRPGTMW